MRQAITETIEFIPVTYKKTFETLLDDPSYRTKEMALIKLCASFPDSQETYLKQTEKIQGLNDKSFRLTWLQLASNASVFNESQKHCF